MDVFRLIADRLHADVCPVYTMDDVEDDKHSLATAMGLTSLTAPPKWTRMTMLNNCNYDQAREMTLMTKEEWATLCKRPDLRRGRTKSGAPKLDAKKVRRVIMAKHGGDAAAWLIKVVGADCPHWFARIMLPIPPAHGSRVATQLENVRVAWRAIRHCSSPHAMSCSDKLEKLVLRWRIQILDSTESSYSWATKFGDDCIETIGTDDPRALVLEVLGMSADNVHPVACAVRYMMSQDFRVGYMQRARTLYNHNVGRWVFDPTLARRCVAFVCNGGGGYKTIIADMENVRRNALVQRAMELGMQNVIDYYEDHSDCEELEKDVQFEEEKREVVTRHAAHGLRVDEFEEYPFRDDEGRPSILRVVHVATGLTNDDLEPLAHTHGLMGHRRAASWFPTNHTSIWSEPDDLCNMFERLAELRLALASHGLTLRDDSRVCAEYVFDGVYGGPDIEDEYVVDQKCGGELARVVTMMIEMDFLCQRTRYCSFMRMLRDSERAKEFALREYLNARGSATVEGS